MYGVMASDEGKLKKVLLLQEIAIVQYMKVVISVCDCSR